MHRDMHDVILNPRYNGENSLDDIEEGLKS